MKKTLYFKTVVVMFVVDGTEYYTFANYDNGISAASNCDRATGALQSAILSKGMIEAHQGKERVFINMTESRTAAVLEARVVEMQTDL